MNFVERPVKNLLDLEAPYHFTYGPIPPLLTESINKIGVTQPPRLYSLKEDSREYLITGKRRIEILSSLNPNSTTRVIIFSHEELTPLDAFEINLFENLTVRKLNPIEKASAIFLLANPLNVPKPVIVNQYLTLMDLPKKEETVDNYLQLLFLDDTSKESLCTGTLQVDTALQLLKFNPQDRQSILHLIKTLHLGFNPQKTIVQMAWEIHKKTGQVFSTLLNSEPFTAFLNENQWSNSQKWGKIEWALRKLRYPILSGLEEKFKNIKKELKLPPAIQLHNPPFFETCDYLMQICFKNTKEFENLLSILNNVLSNQAFKELFKLTCEDESLQRGDS